MPFQLFKPIKGVKSMIDITGVDLPKFIKEVYALSVPAGLGFMHFRALTDDEAQRIIDREGDNGRIAASMDYVNGRQCKMTIFRKLNGKLEINDSWSDHTSSQLDELLRRCGVSR
jgi:hypothetical protein